MTKLNTQQSSSDKGIFNFRNGALAVGLALTMMLSSCGKKTEQKLNDHDTKFNQTEQIDSLQTVTITEHTEILEWIVKKLAEHGVKIENLDTLSKTQTEAITKLYEQDAEFKKQMDELNKVIGKCCDVDVNAKGDTTIAPVTKKPVKKVAKTPTIEDENTPSDTTKTVKPGQRKPSKDDDDGSGWFEL